MEGLCGRPGADCPTEYVVIANIVRFVVVLAGQDEIDGARVEIAFGGPGHGGDMQALPRAIQVDDLLSFPVVYAYIESAGEADNELFQYPVGVSAALLGTGSVIDEEYPLDFEWHVFAALNHGEIAAVISNFLQLNSGIGIWCD